MRVVPGLGPSKVTGVFIVSFLTSYNAIILNLKESCRKRMGTSLPPYTQHDGLQAGTNRVRIPPANGLWEGTLGEPEAQLGG